MTHTAPTPTPEMRAKDDAIYADWLASVESLEAFENHRRSHASRGGHMAGFKALDKDSATLIIEMGRLANHNRALLDVARHVIARSNPHASEREWAARAFEAAAEALAKDWDDVEKRSGPESYRHRDCVRPYRLDEKIDVLTTLGLITNKTSVVGLGWCASRFYREWTYPSGYHAVMPPAVRDWAARRERERAGK
jgi:hypothetical protein